MIYRSCCPSLVWPLLAACIPPTSSPPGDRGPPATVTAWRTTFENGVAVEALTPVIPAPEFRAGKPSLVGTPVVIVDPSTTYQTIDGFGASFLEAGMVNLNRLVELQGQSAADDVMRRLFDPVTGAGFSLMKTVIGGTDFQSASCAATEAGCADFFTYDDGTADPTLARFSIARDLGTNGLIPYIRWARSVGGAFALEAPMDFPPDWMLVGGDPANTVDPQYYGAVAGYLEKYLDAYHAEGIDIAMLSAFNEPGIYTNIPPADLLVLYRDHLAPRLRATHPDVAISFGEPPTVAGVPNLDAYVAVLNDPEVLRNRLDISTKAELVRQGSRGRSFRRGRLGSTWRNARGAGTDR